MPNLRTTVLVKKRAEKIIEGDFIKIGGKWLRVADIRPGYLNHHECSLILVPEHAEDRFDPSRVLFQAHSLVKFKVRTAK